MVSSRKHDPFLSISLPVLIRVGGVFWAVVMLFVLMQPIWTSKESSAVIEEEYNAEQCGVAVVMGASLDATRALFANLHSIIQNYSDERVLCIFIFSSVREFAQRKAGLDCAFSDLTVSSKIRIHVKSIKNDNWSPVVFSKNLLERKELDSDYNWFRFYLKPDDVGGLTKFIWLDTDIILRDNIANLYDWDLNGYPVAGGVYNEPLWHQLCKKNKVELNKIPMTKDMLSPLDLSWNLNAGLIVFDLAEMERQGVLEEWARLKLINDQECIWKIQQSAFTLALHGMFEKLPSEWNLGCLGWMEGFTRQIGEAAAKLHIDSCPKAKALHWNGRKKPWIDYGVEQGAACADIWRAYDIVTLWNKEHCLS